MGWEHRERSVPNYEGIVESLRECLENSLIGLDMAKRDGLGADVTALTALEELDSFLNSLKRDLGV